jgi:hypothetical protein
MAFAFMIAVPEMVGPDFLCYQREVLRTPKLDTGGAIFCFLFL